jgi:hypothetical protein
VESSERRVSTAEMERAMKAQEVILKAAAGKLKWWEAAEIMGVSDRTMRRWRERLNEHATAACGTTANDHRVRNECQCRAWNRFCSCIGRPISI